MRLPRASVPAVATLALLLGGCGVLGGDDQSTTASDSRTTKKPAQVEESSTAPAPESSDPSPEPAGETTAAPAYFVGETPQGPRLYREFQQVDAADPLLATARLLVSGEALDPDYRTLLPGIQFSSVTEESDRIVVTVPDDQWAARPSGTSKNDATIAVQQLVYSLQGVAQARLPVAVQTEAGESVTLLGVRTPVKHRPQLQVLAFVNITSPEEAATVSGTFTASGVASSFEANVPWEIRQDGEVVMDGFATAEGWMDRLYPWTVEVDVSMLPPAAYEFVATTDDPSGGEGGGPTEDSKTFLIIE